MFISCKAENICVNGNIKNNVYLSPYLKPLFDFELITFISITNINEKEKVNKRVEIQIIVGTLQLKAFEMLMPNIESAKDDASDESV